MVVLHPPPVTSDLLAPPTRCFRGCEDALKQALKKKQTVPGEISAALSSSGQCGRSGGSARGVFVLATSANHEQATQDQQADRGGGEQWCLCTGYGESTGAPGVTRAGVAGACGSASVARATRSVAATGAEFAWLSVWNNEGCFAAGERQNVRSGREQAWVSGSRSRSAGRRRGARRANRASWCRRRGWTWRGRCGRRGR